VQDRASRRRRLADLASPARPDRGWRRALIDFASRLR
jgi:hypothetical protein